jgi:hypothetical protein
MTLISYLSLTNLEKAAFLNPPSVAYLARCDTGHASHHLPMAHVL